MANFILIVDLELTKEDNCERVMSFDLRLQIFESTWAAAACSSSSTRRLWGDGTTASSIVSGGSRAGGWQTSVRVVDKTLPRKYRVMAGASVG